MHQGDECSGSRFGLPLRPLKRPVGPETLLPFRRERASAEASKAHIHYAGGGRKTSWRDCFDFWEECHVSNGLFIHQARQARPRQVRTQPGNREP